MTPRERLLDTANSGYYVDQCGDIFLGSKKLNTSITRDGYACIVAICGSKKHSIMVHRLMAYQKFGEKMFSKGIVVRHLDGVRLNNSFENISIGTVSQNRMDIPREVRLAISKKANSVNRASRVAPDYLDQLISDRKNGMTIRSVINKYQITRDRFYHLTKYGPIAKKMKIVA